jgi:hypothetical protein
VPVSLVALAGVEAEVGDEADEGPEGPEEQREVGHRERAEARAGERQARAEEERVEEEVVRPRVRLDAVDQGAPRGGGGAQLRELCAAAARVQCGLGAERASRWEEADGRGRCWWCALAECACRVCTRELIVVWEVGSVSSCVIRCVYNRNLPCIEFDVGEENGSDGAPDPTKVSHHGATVVPAVRDHRTESNCELRGTKH